MGERGESSAKENARLEREVMDTPERNNQIATSISKFEDSPVYTFLNSLSPIKPVKSTHFTQTINPLSFASLPSVFTSPHVSSLKESRFLRRHQVSDPSKPEFSSEYGNTVDQNKENVDMTMKLDEQKENLDPRVAGEPSFDYSKLVMEFAENFNCDRDSQNSSLRPSSCLVAKHVAEFACSSSSLGPLTYRSEGNLLGHIDQNKEPSSCDWESLFPGASDLLAFESPNDTESYKKSVDPATSFFRSIKNAIQNQLCLGTIVSGQHFGDEGQPENMSTQPGEGSEMMENAGTHDIIGGSSISNPNQEMDYEHPSGLYRGMRKRRLFEKGRKHGEDSSGSDSPVLLQSDVSTSNQQSVLEKTTNDSSRLLSGIGLHLNALATTPQDIQIVNHEASPSRLLIGPNPSASFHPLNSCQELLNNSLAEYSLDREIDTLRNSILPVEDSSQESGFVPNEEINVNSPKKKKRKLEQGGEGEAACKRCNCKKSKCLKLYCECFAAGVYCVEPCACIDCFNKPVHEDTVLATRKQIESRNPLAFAPKVIRASDSVSEIRDEFTNTPASARHKRGCNCKKSGCLKKYCECYQGGVGCSINCRCEGCKNAFGRKDGSVLLGTDHSFGNDESDTSEKADQSMDSAPPATPLRAGRQSIHPLSTKKKPPRSSFPSICSSSNFSGFGKTNFFPPPPKFSQHIETVKEDEMPVFLQGGSPTSGVNSSSPNRKRVSPPQGLETSSSAGLRSSRKLILRSIPSFPSLTHNQ